MERSTNKSMSLIINGKGIKTYLKIQIESNSNTDQQN